jgi:ubiquinol-cytochrome c reductase iron-sulfur subunit
MTDPDAGHHGGDNDDRGGDLSPRRDARDGAEESREPRHRVIGTPPPAEATTMLATPPPGTPGGPPQPRPRELPAEPDDPRNAKKAERIVAVCFLISALAGLGFIAAYVIFPVHSVLRMQHSILALGLTMALSFLGLGCGAVFWVRNVMPSVELTEVRSRCASAPEDPRGIQGDIRAGTEASQFVKRPLRCCLIAATVPWRSLDPAAPRSAPCRARHWITPSGATACGCWTTEATGRSGRRVQLPGGMITVVPDGFQDDFNAGESGLHHHQVRRIRSEFTTKSSPVDARLSRTGQSQHRRVLENLHPRRLPGSPV